jgi:eukaryotic-like serine/threonine-protein kinase
MAETTQFAGMGSSGDDGSLKANTILLARYKIMVVLGGGGMGMVYQARDLNFPDVKRYVAVKEMLANQPDLQMRQNNMKTFQREANILATLTHPAIPKIFDSFVQNDRAYLVMEHINGHDLEVLLSKTKELPVKNILDWAIDLCDVLSYLHNNDPDPIIFRDMKPSNVMVDALGKVRLIDFGIAKNFIVKPGEKHTMIGTEGYSAPEQYKGEVNPLSDIYALGATLHHVLTRNDPRMQPPFSFTERPILAANPKVPQALADVISKALAFEARDRWQSCADMKAALERVRTQMQNPSAPAGGLSAAGKAKAATPAVVGGTSSIDDFTADSTGEDKAPTTSGIQPRWTFATEDEIRGGALLARDLAFVGSYDTNMWAVNPEDGKQVWKFNTRGGIATTPEFDPETKFLYFGSEDKSFYAVDSGTGRTAWTFQTKDKIRGSARAAHGHVFFGGEDGFLYALVAANGRELWKFTAEDRIRSRPTVTDTLIIVGSESGELLALELSGKRKWQYRAKKAISSSPVVDIKEGLVYASSQDGYLYCLALASGFSAWRFRAGGPLMGAPVLGDNMAFVASTDGTVFGINTQNGKEKWKFTASKGIVAAPVLHKGALYVGSTDGNLYCLEASNGKERWRFATKGAITSSPFIDEKMILVGSLDKTLYALPLV